MKKAFLLTLLSVLTLCGYAQIAKGYYRVHNLATQRYVYVYDNTGKINMQTTSADMGAIQLWKDHSRTLSDPASIIYINNVSDNQYDLKSQGTGVYEIINYYVQLYPKDNAYQLYASNGSLGKYLADEEMSNVPDGQLGTTNKGDYRKWIVTPIDLEQNYFGINPTLQAGSTYYKPFYADFSFTFHNEGMKAYYISEVYKHIAVIKEISGTCPAATPMLIACQSNQPSHNKLSLQLSTPAKPTKNLLKGVYFNNDQRPLSKDARTKYDAQTMRVFGILNDGTFGLTTSSQEYLAANESYLVVPAGTPSQLILMTEEELATYKENELNSSINSVKNDTYRSGVYSLTGLKVADKVSNRLPKGVYIVDGRKIYVP